MELSINKNIDLAPYCSMKTGGEAKYFALPKTVSELSQIIEYFRSIGERYIVVGNCSNLLFKDSGFDGAVISTIGIRGISFENGVIKANCGESLSSLARFACDNSITGLEFCYGIPGTIGGGIYMNAGAYGSELSQCFVEGEFLDKFGNIISISAPDMGFGYRESILNKQELILLSAKFKGEAGDKVLIRQKMDELMAKRRSAQPLEYPSCGSAFKRPQGNFAGALIEQCGLKGYSIGGAKISEKHAGFIINFNNASSTDVTDLIDSVTEIVFKNTGVKLEPEIRIIE